jgi:hypothetical protein
MRSIINKSPCSSTGAVCLNLTLDDTYVHVGITNWRFCTIYLLDTLLLSFDLCLFFLVRMLIAWHYSVFLGSTVNLICSYLFAHSLFVTFILVPL